jgi:hypothetical protein
VPTCYDRIYLSPQSTFQSIDHSRRAIGLFIITTYGQPLERMTRATQRRRILIILVLRWLRIRPIMRFFKEIERGQPREAPEVGKTCEKSFPGSQIMLWGYIHDWLTSTRQGIPRLRMLDRLSLEVWIALASPSIGIKTDPRSSLSTPFPAALGHVLRRKSRTSS